METWTHSGMDCALRHGGIGAPCGYVAIPESHPFFQKQYQKLDRFIDIHGGLTFSGRFEADPQDRFWIGFDMAHAEDIEFRDGEICILRSDDECRTETNRLAEQASQFFGRKII